MRSMSCEYMESNYVLWLLSVIPVPARLVFGQPALASRTRDSCCTSTRAKREAVPGVADAGLVQFVSNASFIMAATRKQSVEGGA